MWIQHPQRIMSIAADDYGNFRAKGVRLSRPFTVKPLGIVARDGHMIYIYYHELRPLRSCTLDKDWEHPSGAVFAAGTRIRFHDTGELLDGTLARDFAYPGGAPVLRGGSLIHFDRSNRIQRLTLAKDWVLGENGPIAQAGSTCQFHPDGSLRSMTLAQDFTTEPGYVGQAGSRIEYHPGGTIARLTLAEDFTLPSDMVSAAGGEMRWDAEGRLYAFTPTVDVPIAALGLMHRAGHLLALAADDETPPLICTPAQDWRHPQHGFLAPAGKTLRFAPNGDISYVLAADHQLPEGGPLLASGSVVRINAAGTLIAATPARDWRDPRSGTVHHADTETELPARWSAPKP